MRTIIKDTTGNVASLYIVDADGLPKTGVAYNAAGLAVYRTPIGGTQVQITLSADNWTEKGHGRYEVDVADSVYEATGQHDFDGEITDGHIIGERHDVVAELLSSQSIRDAMKLAPSAGDAATGSIDKLLEAPIPANVIQVNGESTELGDFLEQQDIRDSMKLAPSAGAAVDGSIDDQIADAQAYLETNLGANGVNAAEAGGTGDQLTAIPRTGYKLASDGLDAISATRPSGKATTFPGMIVQLFYRFFGKATQTTTELKTYAADGSTVVTTQTISDDGTTETQGEA